MRFYPARLGPSRTAFKAFAARYDGPATQRFATVGCGACGLMAMGSSEDDYYTNLPDVQDQPSPPTGYIEPVFLTNPVWSNLQNWGQMSERSGIRLTEAEGRQIEKLFRKWKSENNYTGGKKPEAIISALEWMLPMLSGGTQKKVNAWVKLLYNYPKHEITVTPGPIQDRRPGSIRYVGGDPGGFGDFVESVFDPILKKVVGAGTKYVEGRVDDVLGTVPGNAPPGSVAGSGATATTSGKSAPILTDKTITVVALAAVAVLLLKRK